MGIKESRAEALADGRHQAFLTDPEMTQAQRQYMYERTDPRGQVWTLGYRSFRKGQEAREALKESIAARYSVTVEHINEAETLHMVRMAMMVPRW